MEWIYLALAGVSAGLTWIVWSPPKRRAPLPSFLVGWLYGELPLHHIAFQLAVTAAFALAGWLEPWPARVGLAIGAGSGVALGWHWRTGLLTASRVEPALVRCFGPAYADRAPPELRARFRERLEWGRILWPFSPRRGRAVRREAGIHFARAGGVDLYLDVYRPLHAGGPRPVLLQIHGGGWTLGSKNEQALPLVYHLAERGWVCVSISYRLSPRATFPDHLIDCKRALAWVRQNIADYGGDPDFVLATGGSAGGHLSALLALTAGTPEYQPGFEDVDTRVQGCLPFYGVYDWAQRTPRPEHEALERLLEEHVMKVCRRDDPEAYRLASPMSRIHGDAPPFFVIHGDADSLVSVEDARDFADLLQKQSRSPVGYLEVVRGEHAFDVFDGARTQYAVNAAERFGAVVYGDSLRSRERSGPPSRRPA